MFDYFQYKHSLTYVFIEFKTMLSFLYFETNTFFLTLSFQSQNRVNICLYLIL